MAVVAQLLERGLGFEGEVSLGEPVQFCYIDAAGSPAVGIPVYVIGPEYDSPALLVTAVTLAQMALAVDRDGLGILPWADADALILELVSCQPMAAHPELGLLYDVSGVGFGWQPQPAQEGVS